MKKFLCLIFSLLLAFSVIPAISLQAEAAEASVITEENPAVVIRTSFATSKFNEGWAGVFTAVPIKDKAGYVLYDVVIWEDRINLYKFPNNLEDNETQGFDKGANDLTTPKGLAAYYKWRESFCLASFLCEDTKNITPKSSSLMKKAYIEFFKIVNSRTPSENIILKYSGHGSLGFCKCMNVEDTKATLKKGMEIFGQKFALIDFGTNCQSSNTDYLQLYHSFTDYMLASQFDYGGFGGMDEWDYSIFEKYNVDTQYSNMFNIGESVRKAAEHIVDITAEYYTLCKNNLIKNKARQSMTLFDMSEYYNFMPQFTKMYSKVNTYGGDAYSLIKKYGNEKLKKAYKKFVVYYKDNNSKDYFIWEESAYGLTVYTLINPPTLSETSYTYNGKAHKPSVNKITLTNGMTLQKGTDYTVSYEKGRKKVGEYKVTVSYKGIFVGYDELYFTVKPQKVSVSKLSAINDGFKLKWKANTAETTGYEIQYSLKSSFASAKTVTVKKAKSTSKTVKKLKSGKKYYVRIRAYKTVDGEKIYSAWSAKKTVKTK